MEKRTLSAPEIGLFRDACMWFDVLLNIAIAMICFANFTAYNGISKGNRHCVSNSFC